MKAVLKIIGGLIAVTLIAVAGLAATQPDTLHVERSVVVAAAPQDVFPYVNDFDLWVKWNPWGAMDPEQKLSFSDNRVGDGAWYAWEGERSGAGKMTITASVPNEKVTEDLVFTAPFASSADVSFTLAAEGDSTTLTWTFDQENSGIQKVMDVFVDMDAMLGADFERGLAAVKPLAEADAAKRKEAEAAAAQAAQAAAEAAPVEGAVAN